MRRAELEGWVYAVKIVRGAYMHQERAKAVKEGYEDPIHSTLEDTHMCYHQVMEDVIERPKVFAPSPLFSLSLTLLSHFLLLDFFSR